MPVVYWVGLLGLLLIFVRRLDKAQLGLRSRQPVTDIWTRKRDQWLKNLGEQPVAHERVAA
jgi:hypothetical protein